MLAPVVSGVLVMANWPVESRMAVRQGQGKSERREKRKSGKKKKGKTKKSGKWKAKKKAKPKGKQKNPWG